MKPVCTLPRRAAVSTGGSISDEVLPAISACDAMLFLCPNYNDAVSANIMALFNRLTNLLVKQDLYQKYLYGIVVSGYSGSDIVARQLLGAMCLNKTAILPAGLLPHADGARPRLRPDCGRDRRTDHGICRTYCENSNCTKMKIRRAYSLSNLHA